MIIAMLVLLGVLKSARQLVLAITAFFFMMVVLNFAVPGGAAGIHPYFADPYRLKLGLVFLIGATFAAYSRNIVFNDLLAALSIITVGVTLRYGGWNIFGYPALVYGILWLAARLPKEIQWIGAKNDYSYGMYVYGFLVQMCTASLGWYL